MNPYGAPSQAPQQGQMYNPVFNNPAAQQQPAQQNNQPVTTDQSSTPDTKADL